MCCTQTSRCCEMVEPEIEVSVSPEIKASVSVLHTDISLL